ncbi:receptor-interacting serine/threonine-protein kinase 3 [Kryptolebias marmoratus]|uniref:Receptor-interacting serine/threonine-protein kinase 3-like n=1 Tax=Kryptolebias marmoratus TaxID=37003 RepID=A0A3Q3EU92_KRYMA|nr:receptor-interacting serine/threonine-protein kinase 3 [Kryptolebias marmoratus]
MALLSCLPPVEIGESVLEDWEVIGSGGFGQIYKARHCQWCCDVAIKLLHYDDGNSSALLREVNMMRKGSSPYVIHVHGVFKGRLPSSGLSVQLGLVMEFMERGSLALLQQSLEEPPPLPLVFRLVHQVSLGINFLHSLSPAVLHLDLKPSNVLLDSSLNAKLTDFGLAKFSQSVTRVSKKDSNEEGGTLSYMPPEAFEISYSPTRSSDIYSFGILLWSIVTGKQPYANAMSSIVKFRIPQGDRPSLDEIRHQAAGRAGLATLMELMQKCWDSKPSTRPNSRMCTTVTEELYKMHKHSIIDAVHYVLKKLDRNEEERVTDQIEGLSITQTEVTCRVEAQNLCDDVPTGPPPVQEMAGSWIANQKDKSRVEDRLTGLCHVDQARTSTDFKMKASSVHPIQTSPQSPSTRRSTQFRATKHSQMSFKEHLSPQYQRQVSSPDTFACHPPSPRTVNMHFSNVTGFQSGNNNFMNVFHPGLSERKRHPSAPPSYDFPHY